MLDDAFRHPARTGADLSLRRLALGLAGAALLARLMESLVFGVTPHDPVRYARGLREQRTGTTHRVIIFGLFEVLMRQLLFAAVLSASVSACGGAPPPGLAPGAPAPAFTLPGVDGRTHSLQDYSDRRVLAVVFTSNTCPASQLYEARIQRLHEEYRGKGVAVVAVNSNQPAAIQLADLAHTDVGESLEDMKVAGRAPEARISVPL